MTSLAKRGRPPKVDLDTISAAVLEIGFEAVTMRRVADHLGVAVSTLYHHVGNRVELIRVASDRALTDLTLPDHRDGQWTDWLRAFAYYIRDAMSAQPELLAQFTLGQLDDNEQLLAVGRALEVLCGYGFEPAGAMAAWEAITAVALGGAIEVVRERAKKGEGRAWPVRAMMALAERGGDAQDLPVLRGFVSNGYEPNTDDHFDRRIDIVLAGIEVCHQPPAG